MRWLLLLLLAAPADAAPRPWITEIAGGTGICGARRQVDCERALPGFNLDLRFGKQIARAVSVGLDVTHLRLPVDGFDSGALWILGPELAGHLAVTDAVQLDAGLRVGVHHVAGVFGSGWGVGTVDLRFGLRYLFDRDTSRRWTAGLDYALTRPARTEVCDSDTCADAELALLHRLSVVVGLRFW